MRLLYFLFFQKILVDESRARSFLMKLKLLWYSVVVSSVGKSRGLLVAWDPDKFKLKPYICCGGLLVTGISLELKEQLSFLNVYGTCSDKKFFWQKLGDRGILSLKNLTVSGDFNFTMNEGEIWGESGHPDPLALFLKEFFVEGGLVDILSDEVVPTSWNGRKGADSIMKRLDRTFVSVDLLRIFARYHAWVAHPFILDHAPVFLQLYGNFQWKNYPFKLNSGWIHEEEFSHIVIEVWKDPKFLQESGLQRRLVWKLKSLKSTIKRWAKRFKNLSSQRLGLIEVELQSLYQTSLTDLNNEELTGRIKEKEVERLKILAAEEDTCRQRSWEFWLKNGDQNTKYFHHFASDRKNHKQIWEIQLEIDHEVTGQKELEEEAVNFFLNLGSTTGIISEEQTYLARLFPNMVSGEEALQLERLCSLEDLSSILKAFSKDKIPGPDR
jgi:hypothetical protein